MGACLCDWRGSLFYRDAATERAEAAHKQFDLEVFASDVLDDNLNTARAGVYPAASFEYCSESTGGVSRSSTVHIRLRRACAILSYLPATT